MINQLDDLDNILKQLDVLVSDKGPDALAPKQMQQVVQQIVELKHAHQGIRRQFDLYQEVIMAMASLDFTKRIPLGNTSDMFQYFATSLNMLNEELADKVVSSLFPAVLMEESDDIILITDGNGVLTQYNTHVSKRFGYGETELIGRPIDQILGAADVEINHTDKEKNRVCLLAKDHELVEVNLKIRTISNDNGIVIQKIYLCSFVKLLDEPSASQMTAPPKAVSSLYENCSTLLAQYKYWEYFVRDPRYFNLEQRFSIMDQFIQAKDASILANRLGVTTSWAKSSIKQAMQVLMHNSTKKNYTIWMKANTPLRLLTKSEWNKWIEQTRYEVAEELIDRLKSKMLSPNFARRKERLAWPIQQLKLPIKMEQQLQNMGIKVVGDFKNYTAPTLLGQKGISKKQLDAIRMALDEIQCLDLLQDHTL